MRFSLLLLLLVTTSTRCLGMLTDGYERAKLFNGGACAHPPDESHATDVVHSDEFGILFVDNVKAGSTMMRQKFQKILGISWYTGRTRTDRTRTDEISEESLADLFVFSIVRDPVEKFQSGVRQAWFQDEKLANFSADELLDKQLSSKRWINEHLQPSTWRLTGHLKKGDGNISTIPTYDFIAALEYIDRDLAITAANIHGMDSAQIRAFVAIQVYNAREPTNKSTLSDDGIRKMCQSPQYKDEWTCLGYDLPTQCQESP